MMEEAERVLPVWVEVENRDGLLKDGMLARVTVLERTDDDTGAAATTSSLRVIEPPK